MELQTINQVFIENVRKFSQDVIIKYKRDKGGEFLDLTWADLGSAAYSFASGLIMKGMNPGDRISFLLANRLEWIVADLGTILAAGINAAIYHTNTPEQCAYIIKDSGSRYIIVEDHVQLEKILSRKHELKDLELIILIDGEPPADQNMVVSYSSLLEEGNRALETTREEINRRGAEVKLDDMATIVYTSGTTGPPKGCMLSHRNSSFVLNSIDEMHTDLFTSGLDLSIMLLPLSHFYPRISSYYINIYKNIPLVIAESIDTLVSNMVETRPSYFCCVPRVLEKLHAKVVSTAEKGPALRRLIFNWAIRTGTKRSRSLNAHKPLSLFLMLQYRIAYALVFKKVQDLLGGQIRFAVCAGAPLSADVGEFIHSMGIQVIEFYGLTETIGGTMTTMDHCRYGTVGKAMPGFDVHVASDGEILIKGNNFMGYHNKDELTAEILKDGWCYTGDIGYWDDDGFLHITDRKKDLIITSGGKNISPQNLENMLKAIPLVSNAMVYGDRRKYLTALLTLEKEETEALAKEKGIAFSNFEELTQNPEVRKNLRKSIDQMNSELAQYETIKDFAILPRDLSLEEGEITPTLKLKRKIITEKYSDVLTSMYEEGR
ncbi:MAG TPA: AMP-dependent synthetase/ligase [Deltaproteobacteria bacterium]|nr:AMP-dependent synthetase/ligase [Deltaproteobacteria bacterium]